MRIDVRQLEFIDQKLRNMLMRIELVTGFEFTITSLYRIGDDGNHGQLPLRAVDLRCWDVKFGKPIEAFINDTWVYDPGRPHLRCCIIHDTGQGLHFHLQVHPNTEAR